VIGATGAAAWISPVLSSLLDYIFWRLDQDTVHPHGEGTAAFLHFFDWTSAGTMA
jgi:hypothetical protein